MSEIGALFSRPMIHALLREVESPGDGKTQTRRLADLDVKNGNVRRGDHVEHDAKGRMTVHTRPTVWRTVKPGHRIWVKENHFFDSNQVVYAADAPEHSLPKLVSSLMMKRSLSRLTLIVTKVRIEPLQAISENDAKAEGAIANFEGEAVSFLETNTATVKPKYYRAFKKIWTTIHGNASWKANPEVVVVTFSVILDNIANVRDAA